MAELIYVLRTTRTYATYENARRAIEKAVATDYDGVKIPYLIAATVDGRFAPVAIGPSNILLAHRGITVVG